MSRTYRIAIVGVGAIAGMHARAIADLPNAELVAGSCRTESKGREFVKTHGGTWYPDYETMLDEAKPDLVTICTPSGAHLEPTAACAKRGIHVLCEKPAEITTERVDEMIRVTQDAGVLLGGIFPQRYNPVVRAVYDAAKAGRFGDVATINSYVPWWRDDAYYAPERWQGTQAMDGGGAMMNQSIHGVDTVQWLAGAADPSGDPTANPVEEVFAYTARRGHPQDMIEVEDTAVALLRFRSGAIGQLLGATSMFPGTLKRLLIGGRNGTAEIMEDELTTFGFREPASEDDAIRERFGARTSTGGGASDPMAIGYDNHTRNIAGFLDALDGKAPLLIDGREARKAVAVIEAIYASAKTGKPVQVAP